MIFNKYFVFNDNFYLSKNFEHQRLKFSVLAIKWKQSVNACFQCEKKNIYLSTIDKIIKEYIECHGIDHMRVCAVR